MTEFESIFGSNTQIDPNLDGLFKKKKRVNPDSNDILSAIIKSKESENTGDATPIKPKSEVKKGLSRREKLKKRFKLDPETENRTIFVGNLPLETKKENLIKIFKQYGKIETIRFRNIVPNDPTKSKKYAFITKQFFSQKKTMNAYLRFENVESAKNAIEMNGMEYESHHLRVDLATSNKTHDNKRSIFLGGLPCIIEEESIRKHFDECGPIDNIRIIRDNRTGIGKGIGYIKFQSLDSVTLALKLNGSELESRKIRVERCSKKQKINKKIKTQNSNTKQNTNIKFRNNKKQSKSNNKKFDKQNERKKLRKIKTNTKPTNKFKF